MLTLSNPDLLAVAVIVPALVAFTLMTALPLASVVPLPVTAPVRVIVAPFTGAFALVAVKVTLVGIATVTTAGVADKTSAGCGIALKVTVMLPCSVALKNAVIVTVPAVALVKVVPATPFVIVAEAN
jgi:hypothetical protein